MDWQTLSCKSFSLAGQPATYTYPMIYSTYLLSKILYTSYFLRIHVIFSSLDTENFVHASSMLAVHNTFLCNMCSILLTPYYLFEIQHTPFSLIEYIPYSLLHAIYFEIQHTLFSLIEYTPYTLSMIYTDREICKWNHAMHDILHIRIYVRCNPYTPDYMLSYLNKK